MRRILLTAAFLIATLPLCTSAFAQESPTPRPYVEAGASPLTIAELTFPPHSVATDSTSAVPVPAEMPVITEAPAAVPAATPASAIRMIDLSGDWCGSWKSCVNGHNGPMRANFCRLCDGNYKVTFVGRFLKVIPFRYSTTLNVTGYGDGVVYLSGSQSLGPIFGTFTYNAWANDRQFASGYTASKDQGQFVLSR